MDISNMDLKDLKSLGFDILNDLQRLQSNLSMVNQQIAKKEELIKQEIEKANKEKVKEVKK